MSTLRKILTTGVGAALMTESGLRSAISDIKLRETIGRQMIRGKEELARVLAGEVKRFLERVNIHEEIQKALSGMTVEVQATVKLTPTHIKKGTHVTVKRMKIKKLP
jgi:hypothetical protein